jgi:hypothetical protein
MANYVSKFATRWIASTFHFAKDVESNYMLYMDLATRVPEPRYLIFWFFPPIETGGNHCEYAS